MKLPLASILTQLLVVSAPVVVTNAVVFPLRVPLDGATPAPPPITGLFADSTPDDAMVVPPEKYGMPPLVPDPIPVPPRATESVLCHPSVSV